MDLKTFVSETVRQVIDGIVEAQKGVAESGAFINPGDRETALRNFGHTGKSRFAFVPGGGNSPREIQEIEFDVAVTVSETSDKKGGIGVASSFITLGTSKATATAAETASRIKFKVPIAFPLHPGTAMKPAR